MPLKDLGPLSRWHWREAIAWIAFNIPDAGSSFWLSKPTIEQIGIEKLEAEIRARTAIAQLVKATKEDRLNPIWAAPWPGDLDFDKSDAPFKRWALKTEEKMLEGLKGIVASGYPLDGLYYDQAALIKGWPSDLAEGAEQDEPGPQTDVETDEGQDDAQEAGQSANQEGTATSNDPSPVDIYSTGLPGQPTIKHLILSEFERRVTDKEFKSLLSQEAKELQAWAKSEHPKAPNTTNRTIENHIRSRHSEAKSNLNSTKK